MLPIWLLAAMMIMMYYWRFWEPWANAMLAILLPKLWFGLKIMSSLLGLTTFPLTRAHVSGKRLVAFGSQSSGSGTGTTVFGCLHGAHLTLTGPKKASKSTILHNRLNKEKAPGRCCQSGNLLPL